IKSALSKVLGMFESNDRFVFIDRNAPKPRIPFIKLHEAGHGRLPHQCKMYKLVHDCEKTLDPYITDLFEREANVFASEVLFQGDVFSNEAHGQSFGMKVPMKLAKKYGASNYATFRRYVMTSPNACCLVVLEPSQYDDQGDLTAQVRRVVPSKLFEKLYDEKVFGSTVNVTHPLGAVVPRKRMCYPREVLLTDRDGDERICRAEAFDTGHHTLILLRDTGLRNHSGIAVPANVS
ncbi:MAG TPA: ImmA/IrrE family metallo-endopeptidase, partial [Candidatus Angelobacter sp.]